MLAALQKPAAMSKRLLFLYNVIITLAITISSFYLQWHTFAPFLQDFFNNIWSPGHLLLNHEFLPPIFPYPLWTPVIFLPINLLSEYTAYAVWTIGNLILLSLLIVALLYLFEWHTYIIAPMLVSLLISRYYPVYVSILAGQFVILGSLWFVLIVWALRGKRWMTVGILLGLSLIKPQLIALFMISIFALAAWQRRWRVFLGFGVVLLMFILISIPFAANFRQIFGGNFNQQLQLYMRSGSTIWGLSFYYLPDVLIVPFVVSLVLLLPTIYLWVRAIKTDRLGEQLYFLISITTIVNLIVLPYGWSYDQTVLLFAIFYGVQLAFSLARRRRILYLALLCMITLFLHPLVFYTLDRPIESDIYGVIPSSLLLLVLILLQREVDKRRSLSAAQLPGAATE